MTDMTRRGVFGVVCLLCCIIAGEFSAVPNPPTDLEPYTGVCTNCTEEDGVCYNPHPTDCDKFVQCYFAGTGHESAAYRQCPFGRYWDQSIISCRDSKEVECKNERCRLKDAPMNYPLSNNGGCKAHWTCEFKKSTQSCCAENYRYKPFEGCVLDKTCKDQCPQTESHVGKCDAMPVAGKPGEYLRYVPGVTGFKWHHQNCPKDTHFSIKKCECVYHIGYEDTGCRPKVYIPFQNDFKDYSGNKIPIINHNAKLTQDGQMAYFDGNSYLEIPNFDKWQYDELVIAVKLLQYKPSDNMMGIISNYKLDTTGKKMVHPSILILKSGKSIHYLARTIDREANGNNSTPYERKTETFHVPMRYGNWNTLYYMHDQTTLEGVINEVGTQKWSIGKIETVGSSLYVGYSRGFYPFVGYIDEIAVYLCRPGFL